MDLLIHEDSLIWCLNKQKQLSPTFQIAVKCSSANCPTDEPPLYLRKYANRKGIYCILKDNIIIRLTFEHNGIQETEIVNMIPFAEADEHIRTLHEDAYGQLWIGTSRNLYRYSLSNHKLEKMWASAPMVNDIITDGRTVFIATENNGLLVIDGQGTKKIKIAGNCLGLALLPGKNPLDQHGQRQHTPLRPATQYPASHGSGMRPGRQQHLWHHDRPVKGNYGFSPGKPSRYSPGEQTFSTLRASSPPINMENFLCMYKDSNDCFHIGGTNGYLTVRADAFLDQQKKRVSSSSLQPSRSTPRQDRFPRLQRLWNSRLPHKTSRYTFPRSRPCTARIFRFCVSGTTGRHEEGNILPPRRAEQDPSVATLQGRQQSRNQIYRCQRALE